MSVSLAYINNFQNQPYVDNESVRLEERKSHEENQTLTTASTVVTLSEESKRLSENDKSQQNTSTNEESDSASEEAEINETEKTQDKETTELTEDEVKKVAELKARDIEVKTHEQAHAMVGGKHAGSPSYTYEQGHDGNNYAVEGEVPIDVSTIANDPQATISKMQQVYQAALAPAQPSSADRSIAADSQSKISAARAELLESKNETIDNKQTDRQSNNSVNSDSNDTQNDINNYRPIDSYLLNSNTNTIGGTLSKIV
ncbi:putative metalloprotease CJM1_0395 family protein [Marinomonas sp. 15G1-11]|uniref:Metalloprotease CJM1_0395 family protein n=1 Tax=Marinomonas phaeophyticola TaxID=3004091 RepID=A0ABT4JR19_9GAMM|nr:putative metalloprotease CJM1_0395 family protein [Marinomonas sp. 15G1-11]MCZ2720467.1 putative metalloprotease CJM1_0395 family protein [Marinomonas sp. 15G1-11]